MCIAVLDTCILAKSNQLIKYSSPSNSQSEALKQNRMASFSLSCSINWLAIFGGSGLLNKKCSFCRACSTHEHLMEFSRCSLSANSINVHQEMGSQLMISGWVYCVRIMNKFITILTFQNGAREVPCPLVPMGLDTPLVVSRVDN